MSWHPSGRHLDRSDRRDALLFFVVALAAYWISCPGPTGYDQYARLARVLIHGSLSLPQRPPHLEMAEWQGRAYFTNPPTPALLLAPIVWIAEREPLRSWLLKKNGGFDLPLGYFQTYLSLLVGAAAVAVCRLALARIPVTRRGANWGTVLFGFGSIYWYHATIGSVWYIAQTVHGLAMWLVVLEWLGRGRPVLLGLGLAAAFWCRMETVVAVPFVLVARPDCWLAQGSRWWRPRLRLGWLTAFALPIAAVLALNAGYNWVRFGVFGNQAYELLLPNAAGFGDKLLDPSRWYNHVYMLFKQPPIYSREYPWVIPAISGLSIWYTTPAFLYSLRAPLDRLTAACWIGILLFCSVLFQFGGTGMSQLGYRFAMDFYPLLTVLTIRGMDPPIRPWHMALIVAGVVFNAWGIWVLTHLEIGRLF
jgi:hypothetical protein